MFDDFIKIPVILLFQRVRNKILHVPKHAEVSVQKLGAVTNLIHSSPCCFANCGLESIVDEEIC